MGTALQEEEPLRQTPAETDHILRQASLDVGSTALRPPAEVIYIDFAPLPSDGQESPWTVPRGQEWTTSDDIRRAQTEGRARPYSPADAVRKYLNS